jgi:CheY-like chemotaxis protein
LRIANRGSRIEDRGSRIEDDHPQSAIRNPQSAILVLGDPDRLQQMVWNLLSNAVKFTPPGGSVHVQLQRRESYAELMVSDTGQGIKPEFLPLVFDRFLQADGSSTRRYGGLGLGLAIVRHLVELHGGSVTAKSDGEGKGSTFIVSLPLADKITELDGLNHLSKLPDSTAPVEFARPVISSIAMPVAEQVFINDLSQGNLPRLDGVNVLVVDDETETCDLLNYILTQCGADVRVAGGTEDALSALKGWRVDLLVSDLGMPNREAENLINSLQQRIGPGWHQPPAVALTARSRAEDRIRALSAGYRINVTKPIEPAELVVAAASLVGRLSNSGTA